MNDKLKLLIKLWKHPPTVMCGFIAQLVEQRTGNAEVTGSNPVEALVFFRLLLSNCLNWKIYCDDHSSLSSTTAVQKWIIFIYLTSVCSNLCRSPTCQIESKAFLKPTKQAYIFSLWLWTYLSIKVRGAKTWSAVRLFGKKPIWDLWRWSVFKDMTCSRSRWFKMGRNNFPSQLETQISR